MEAKMRVENDKYVRIAGPYDGSALESKMMMAVINDLKAGDIDYQIETSRSGRKYVARKGYVFIE